MLRQVPLFRGSRELKFSVADIAAIRAAERVRGTVIEVQGPMPNARVARHYMVLTSVLFVLCLGACGLLRELWTNIENSTRPDQTPPFSDLQLPTATSLGGIGPLRGGPRLVHRASGSFGSGRWSEPVFEETTPIATPISKIEAELKMFPLHQPLSIVLNDFAHVQPPPEVLSDGTPEFQRTVERGSEIDEPPVLRRRVSPQPRSQENMAQIQPQHECQVVPQPEITRSPAATREAENEENKEWREYEADVRHHHTELAKRKVKKPSRLRRVLSGFARGYLTVTEYPFELVSESSVFQDESQKKGGVKKVEFRGFADSDERSAQPLSSIQSEQ